MFTRLSESESLARATDFRGTTIYGVDEEKLGKLEDIIYDADTQKARYAIVDTGGVLRTHRILIPAEHIVRADDDTSAFYANVSKDQAEQLPEFDRDLLSKGGFTDYETRYRSAWQRNGFATSGSEYRPRLRDRIDDERELVAGLRAQDDDAIRNESIRQDSVTPIRDTAVASTGAPVSIYGVFGNQEKLENAVEKLKDAGFPSEDISVVFPDKGRTERFAVEHNTKAPEGAAVGGGTGIIAGGVLGWLAGIGTLAIPGIGPLLAAGPIVAALAGAGVGGAIGGIAGGLIGLGVPELEAKHYEKEIREGRMLVSVRCTDPRFVESARTILDGTGAKDIFQTGERLAA